MNEKLARREDCCAVCLCNDADTITKCSHSFHLKCIFAWLERKVICPVCNSKKASQLKFYCQKCFKNYLSLDMKVDRGMDSYLLEGKAICPDCQLIK